jgi:hypothetical protein
MALERHLGTHDPGSPESPCPATRTVAVNNFQEDVLLEIFDFYRQNLQDLRDYYDVDWNNKDGWFELAHVCQIWRSVVLASPSRLRLRLYLLHDRPTVGAVPEFYSHLPIIIDYRKFFWDADTLRRLNSALRSPDRVLGIAIIGPYTSEYSASISKALDLSFFVLESRNSRNK